jgi:hypothetical protein
MLNHRVTRHVRRPQKNRPSAGFFTSALYEGKTSRRKKAGPQAGF